MLNGTTTTKMKKRMFWWIGVAVILALAVLIGQLVNIQLVHGAEYANMAANQQLSDISIPAKRGTIYDTKGNVLAQSGTVWTVSLAPVQIPAEQKEAVAKGLAEILSLDEATVLEKAKQDVQYAKVKMKVESADADKVRALIEKEELKGIYLTEDSKRFYPQGTLAASLLGFTGTDNQGLAGVEYWYDDLLKGTPGRQVSAKNALNADMPSKYERVYEAVNGNDLVLSIDQNIQYYLEKYLAASIKEFGVQEKSCGIVMEVKTGKILAMATEPSYDPNTPFTIYDSDTQKTLAALQKKDEAAYETAFAAAQQSQWRNKCVSDLYEPGSVFKTITAASALEEKVVTPSEQFNCRGFIKVGVWRYNCALTSGHGAEDFTTAFGNSCNPIFVEVAQRLGADRFSQYLNAFGYANGDKTGIDLPGEAGIVGHTSFSIYDLSSNSFGQTIKVTPVQMISACCSVINGGYLYTPQVVKQIVKDNGTTVETVDPILKRQVISESTSALMRQIMKQNVESGGGKNVAVSGYSVGGKSGTSQKLDSTDKSARVASFFAFAPAESPEIAVLIIADEPTIGYRYGSTVAAPICSKVLADALPYLGIEPQYTASELTSLNRSVPKVTGLAKDKAEAALEKDSFKYRVIGSGDKVLRQVPAAASTAPKGSVIILYTDNKEAEKVEVPNFKGLTYTQTVARAQALGLNIRPQGVVNSSKCVASSQSVAAAAKADPGTVITVQFIENDVTDMADD